MFRKIFLKSLIQFHQNYSDQYKLKLEILYVKLNLDRYSLKKIKSYSWDSKIEAIKELSTLHYEPGFKKIEKLVNHKNMYVQGHALLGCYLLNGFYELIFRKDSENLFLNDWIQSHIIYTIKTNKTPIPKNLIELLEAKNQSFVLLGIRLIDHYHAIEYLPVLEKKLKKNPNSLLKNEYISTIEHLNTY